MLNKLLNNAKNLSSNPSLKAATSQASQTFTNNFYNSYSPSTTTNTSFPSYRSSNLSAASTNFTKLKLKNLNQPKMQELKTVLAQKINLDSALLSEDQSSLAVKLSGSQTLKLFEPEIKGNLIVKLIHQLLKAFLPKHFQNEANNELKNLYQINHELASAKGESYDDFKSALNKNHYNSLVIYDLKASRPKVQAVVIFEKPNVSEHKELLGKISTSTASTQNYELKVIDKILPNNQPGSKLLDLKVLTNKAVKAFLGNNSNQIITVKQGVENLSAPNRIKVLENQKHLVFDKNQNLTTLDALHGNYQALKQTSIIYGPSQTLRAHDFKQIIALTALTELTSNSKTRVSPAQLSFAKSVINQNQQALDVSGAQTENNLNFSGLFSFFNKLFK